MSYNKSYINKVVYPKGTNVNVRRYPSTAATVKLKTGEVYDNLLMNVKSPNPVGRNSGNYIKLEDGIWWRVNLYKTVLGRTYGYVRNDVMINKDPDKSPIGENNGNKLLNDLVNNDIKVYKNLLLVAEMIDNARKSGFNVSNIENRLQILIKRYNERQKEIRESGLVKTSNWFADKWAWIQNKWKDAVNGVGELATGIAVAIGAVAALATAGIIYYAFKPKFDDSKADLKVTEELRIAASKLSPEQSAKLMNDLEAQIDTAYNQGKKDQMFKNLFGSLRNIGIAVGTFLVLDKFVFNRNEK